MLMVSVPTSTNMYGSEEAATVTPGGRPEAGAALAVEVAGPGVGCKYNVHVVKAARPEGGAALTVEVEL